jgi:hypothetical protein
MKIGMIFECGPQGADKQVCEYLARKLLPDDNEIVSRTLDNKARLLNEAGRTAKLLLDDGCDRVLIIWDLRPAWPDQRYKPCRYQERQALLGGLRDAGLASAPIFLVCIEQELESWVLADETKLNAFLSSPAHGYDAKQVRHPDRVQQPKASVINHFKMAGRGRYNDVVHALRVVSVAEPNWNKLRRSDSFARFEKKLRG